MLSRAVTALRTADSKLGRLIERVGACRLEVEAVPPFEGLLSAIVHQQLNGKAARSILDRVLAQFPRGKARPEALLRLDERVLRGAGLSRAKTAAVYDLAEKTLAGVVPSHRTLLGMEDEEIVERLTAVRGVGRWTVEMLLIFRLGRLDVLPVNDYGVRKGFALTFHPRARREELPLPADMVRRAERWRPYRSVASWYLWRAVDGG